MDEQLDPSITSGEPFPDSPYPSTKPRREYDTGTKEAMKVFGKPDAGLHRGTALRHERGDILIIIGIIWPVDGTANPPSGGVVMRRTRDGKLAQRGAAAVRELIASGELVYDYRFYEDPVSEVVIKVRHGKRYLLGSNYADYEPDK